MVDRIKREKFKLSNEIPITKKILLLNVDESTFGDTKYFIPPIKFYSESAHWRHVYNVFPPVGAPRSLQPLGRSCQNYVYEKIAIPLLIVDFRLL